MPWASDQLNSSFYQPLAIGPIMLCTPDIPTLPTASPIAASGTWNSGILAGDGYKMLSIGVTSSQGGSLTVQRYLDINGTVAQGAASTAALTAGTAAVLNINDGLPYATYRIIISNTGASAATVTNFAVLMAAA